MMMGMKSATGTMIWMVVFSTDGYNPLPNITFQLLNCKVCGEEDDVSVLRGLHPHCEVED